MRNAAHQKQARTNRHIPCLRFDCAAHSHSRIKVAGLVLKLAVCDHAASLATRRLIEEALAINAPTQTRYPVVAPDFSLELVIVRQLLVCRIC